MPINSTIWEQINKYLLESTFREVMLVIIKKKQVLANIYNILLCIFCIIRGFILHTATLQK